MLYVDRRLLGVEEWYQDCLPEDYGMELPDGVLKSVCFLGQRDAKDRTVKPFCTGFLVAWSDDGGPGFYLVTAGHCLPKRGAVWVILNRKDGKTRRTQLTADGWRTPHDKSVDLAIHPIQTEDKDDVAFIARDHLLTAARIEKHRIGLGDDVWLPGLFQDVVGKDKGRPIVRVGTIAAVPGKPIQTVDPVTHKDRPPFSAYLVEVRSHSGLSGSPVWVHLPYGRGRGHLDEPPVPSFELRRHREVSSVIGGTPPDDSPNYLLGVLRMHWGHEGATGKEVFYDAVDERNIVNTGIAAVVPIQELTKLLDREDIVVERREEGAAVASRRGRSVAIEDAPPAERKRGPKAEDLKIDGTFEDAAKKLTRTPSPEGGFPKPATRKRKPRG